MPDNRFKVGEVRVVRPGRDPDELLDKLSDLYGNDIDFDRDIKRAYEDSENVADKSILDRYGSSVDDLSPMAQKFYARSMASISKVIDPSRDELESYNEILQTTSNFLSQRQEMTEHAAASSVYSEAARANDSLDQAPIHLANDFSSS